jgi:hypothetical protein
MAGFHIQLALDYLRGRAIAERTTDTLRGIVAHVCTTYALSAEESARVQDGALQHARQRGLVREEALRRKCYPAWIKSGKLDASDAYYQLQAMEAIVRTLRQFDVEQRQLSLFGTGT